MNHPQRATLRFLLMAFKSRLFAACNPDGGSSGKLNRTQSTEILSFTSRSTNKTVTRQMFPCKIQLTHQLRRSSTTRIGNGESLPLADSNWRRRSVADSNPSVEETLHIFL